ncbi:thiol-disulfide oxidoreductase DCC family protein [Pedosphaera parvula]|uniref:Putative thiol-disulphide oxidoreductase DCC n=1 Tax=Pedosphaera parvula (strain Ellin514) TaxID=320771 RepID=B9XGN8_PEDPL|nr:DCC1-like thiol-disulfide oxidoreductase family protein [Pedosphaera parvula]EEF61089.1 putative thiol-disulphide oxidoreductase DCC [Pedosphaera parvula Ellin514]
MNTEITERYKGWVVYDADCALCRTWAGRTYRILRGRGFRLVPFHVEWVRKELGLKEGQLPDEMRLLNQDGKNIGGADAVVEIARTIWWAFPIYAVSRFPGMLLAFRTIYRTLAKRRNCIGKVCRLPQHDAKHAPEHSITSAFFELP